jgi:RNA polymerase sigma-70 factor (ECF subfamily)
MVSEHDTDETLMLQYCAGDYAAFEALYRRHGRGVYRFIAWQCPRIDWAEEIVQDAWMSLHRARDTYRPTASFKTLLYQIARNRMIDLLRQRTPVLATELGVDEADHPVFDHLLARHDPSESPEITLENQQLNQSLYRAIAQLPYEQKEALVLHQFSELSLGEIARMTGAKEETVKGRLRYAMQKLRQCMVETA